MPQLNKPLVLELARGHYLDAKENVLLIGQIGTGKTHVATALGVAACRQGARVRFLTAAGLVNELLEAQATHRLSRYEQGLLRLHLLILDEVGFVPFTKLGADLSSACSRPCTSRSVSSSRRRCRSPSGRPSSAATSG